MSRMLLLASALTALAAPCLSGTTYRAEDSTPVVKGDVSAYDVFRSSGLLVRLVRVKSSGNIPAYRTNAETLSIVIHGHSVRTTPGKRFGEVERGDYCFEPAGLRLPRRRVGDRSPLDFRYLSISVPGLPPADLTPAEAAALPPLRSPEFLFHPIAGLREEVDFDPVGPVRRRPLPAGRRLTAEFLRLRAPYAVQTPPGARIVVYGFDAYSIVDSAGARHAPPRHQFFVSDPGERFELLPARAKFDVILVTAAD